MNPGYRKQLLGLMAKIEQNIAEAETLTVGAVNDETLQRATWQPSRFKRMLANIEHKLNQSRGNASHQNDSGN